MRTNFAGEHITRIVSKRRPDRVIVEKALNVVVVASSLALDFLIANDCSVVKNHEFLHKCPHRRKYPDAKWCALVEIDR